MTRNRPIILVLTCAALVLAFATWRSPLNAQEHAKQPERIDVIKKLYQIEKRLSAIEERLAGLHNSQASNKKKADKKTGARQRELSELEKRAMLKLKEPLPINFEGNKLVNVIDYFRNTTGVNFYTDWAGLEAAGIEQDAQVTLQLTNVPADMALKLVLHQVSGGAKHRAVFEVIDGVIAVATRKRLKQLKD